MLKRWVVGSALFLLALLIAVPLMAQEDLTQIYTSLDGSISLNYPEGWIVQDGGLFTSVYNNQNAADTGAFAAPHPGEAALQIIPPATHGPGTLLSGNTPEAAIAKLVGTFSNGAGAPGDVTSLTVGSYPAVRAVITTAGNSDGVIIVIDLGNGQLVAAIGSAAQGELANYEPTFDAIIASLSIIPTPGLEPPPEMEESAEPPQPTSNAPSIFDPESITPQNAPQLRQIWSTQVGNSCITAAAFSPDSKTIVVCDTRTGGLLLNSATGEPIQPIRGDNINRGYQEVFTPDGQTLYTAAVDLGLVKWNLAKGADTIIDLGADTTVMQMVVSPDGSKLAYVTKNPAKIGIILADGTKTEFPLDEGYEGTNLAYSPQGDTLLYNSTLGMGNTDIWLWDIASGKQISMIEVKGGPVGVFYTPNAKPIAVTTDFSNNDVLVWDVTSNTMIEDFKGHTDQVSRAAFSPDSMILATTSWDLSVRLWDMKTGQQLISLPHQNQDLHAVFSPDGKALLTTDQLGNTVLWGINKS